MKTELLGQEKNIVKVKVEFDAGEIAASLNKTLQELSQKINIPGFRKGRASRKAIEMRFGRESLYNEVISQMLKQAATQVVGDYDLDTIAPPSYDADRIHIREGEPLTCELTFEVAPEVSLPEFQDIEVEKLRVNVTDKLLDQTVEKFRNNLAKLNSIERAVEENDVVFMTFTAHIVNPDGSDEKTEPPQDSLVDMSNPTVQPEIKNALLGKFKGDSVSAELKPQIQNTEGRKLCYDMTVKDVLEKIFPEMEPEFYKQVLDPQGDSAFETAEAFRTELRQRMATRLEEEYRNQALERAVAQVVSLSQLELPGTLLKRQAALQRSHDEEDCQKRFGMSLEKYLRNNSISPEAYTRDSLQKAEALVRRTLVLEELANKFGVEVTKEDIDVEFIAYAQTYNIELAKVKAMYYKNENLMAQLSSDLRHRKAVLALGDKVRFRDVDADGLSAQEEGE
ncbi:MAG: trigger factor [Synergistaceae bacterium]|jgi:trigger factor|nr:trigger factor [Synergistaceae bacterium]